MIKLKEPRNKRFTRVLQNLRCQDYESVDDAHGTDTMTVLAGNTKVPCRSRSPCPSWRITFHALGRPDAGTIYVIQQLSS